MLWLLCVLLEEEYLLVQVSDLVLVLEVALLQLIPDMVAVGQQLLLLLHLLHQLANNASIVYFRHYFNKPSEFLRGVLLLLEVLVILMQLRNGPTVVALVIGVEGILAVDRVSHV